MRRCAFLAALMVSLLSLGGCFYVGDWENSDAYKEDFHSTHALNPGGRITVESFNGSIDLTGWEQNSVEVNGTKYASSRNALDELKIDISSTPDSIRIRAARPSDLHFRMGVRFSIRVPHKALLEMISSSNGKIQIEDVEGRTRLHTSNGSVRVSRLKGDLEARTSNGSVEARDVDGNVDLHTSNGSIRAESIRGSLQAVSSNGSIIARLTDPARNWPVRVESSNGHVELTLDGKMLPDVHASTSNSSIVIRLPGTVNARVRAHTSHSAIHSEFDELHAEGRHQSDMEGTLGNGGALIELSTNNGGIKIQKM